MINILFSYDFLVVAIGTSILAIASAMVGCFSVYKGQSLVGDAIGHSTYPGVVLAFMIFQTRNPAILTIGAALFGIFAYWTIQAIVNNSKIKLDAELSTSDMSETANFIVENKVKAIFAESTTDPKRMEKLQESCKEQGFEVKVVQGEGKELFSDSLSAKGEDADTYIKMVKHNVNLIVENLK